MEPYERLIQTSNLYPEQFIQLYGVSSPHWGRETWRQREMSLRHDMVCSLLCNLTKRDKQSRAGPSKPKQRKTDDPTNDDQSTSSETESSSDKAYRCAEWTDQPADEDLESEEEGTITYRFDREKRYRFTLLEGKLNIGMIQNKYATKWKTTPPEKMWDLIDRDQRKYVEVKVTVDFSKAKSQYYAFSALNQGHTALFIINPNTLKYEWVDHTGDAPGVHKVISFLANRKAMIEEMGVMESDLSEEYNITTQIFTSDRFTDNVFEWIKPMWELRNTPLPPNFATDEYAAVPITPDALIKHLEDPRERVSCPIINWDGKVLPPILCDSKATDESTDKGMVEEFLQTLFNLEGEEETLSVLNAIITNWEEAPDPSTFRFISKRDLSKYEENDQLESYLGVGSKGREREDGDNTTRQPEPKPHVQKQYHPWFDNMIEDLSTRHHFEGMFFSNLIEPEIPPDHPMSKIVAVALSRLLYCFSRSNIAAYSSKVVNLYSRLGGAYLGDDRGNSNHGNVSIFPLYSVSHDYEENTYRYIDGVCIRAPHHAVKTTDRIGMITIEKLTKHPHYVDYQDYLAKHKRFQANGEWYVLRVNSIKKIDPSYLTFIENSLFVTSNLVGEILLNGLSSENPTISPANPEQWIMDHRNWLMERITEAVLNATLGGPQEEGMFSVLRKIFMVLIAWTRGQRAATWDIAELCDKMNECIIDHPLAMHYQVSLIDIIRHEFLNKDI